jgi:bifunctional UDP-N-acetylglucosamine pyrophosphorylase/glucosamine-1-phosphate N-acetyltransferase
MRPSTRAKVLHEVAGTPLVTWVVRAARPVVDRVVVVVGHEREAVMATLAGEGVSFAVQERQEGTGHAVLCAAEALEGVGTALVLLGDAPFIEPATLRRLLSAHRQRGAAASVLSFEAPDPSGYGRLVRDGDLVREIVEEKLATDAQRAIRWVNSGAFAIETAEVLPRVARLPRRPGGEIYLTDVVASLVADGLTVAWCEAPEAEAMGINTPDQLAAAERVAASRPGHGG